MLGCHVIGQYQMSLSSCVHYDANCTVSIIYEKCNDRKSCFLCHFLSISEGNFNGNALDVFVSINCDRFFYHTCSLVFSGVRVTRSLVLCIMFVDRCLSFCPFSFDHCVVCSSIYGFWLPPFGIFKLFFQSKKRLKIQKSVINSLMSKIQTTHRLKQRYFP
jgi:hypothetical protein